MGQLCISRQKPSIGVILAAVLLGACGGKSSTPTSPSTPAAPSVPAVNHAPVIVSVTGAPAFGIADLQVFQFEVTATDPDGDSLTYAWDLTYGATSTARRPTGQYFGGVSTTWTVSVVVSDGRGGTASGSVSVVLGSLNGLWRVQDGVLAGASFGLLQNDAGVVTGNYGLPGAGTLENLTDGRITLDGSVALPLRLGSRVFTFSGTLEAPGRRVAGVLNGAGYSGAPCVLLLQ